MADNKTKPTKISVAAFIDAITDEGRRADAKALVKLMQKASGEKPKMWGPSIIGFGSHHYVYDSGREGDMPLIAFSPRKAATVLYGLSVLKRSCQNSASTPEAKAASTSRSWLMWTRKCWRQWPPKLSLGGRDNRSRTQGSFSRLGRSSRGVNCQVADAISYNLRTNEKSFEPVDNGPDYSIIHRDCFGPSDR